MKREEKEKGSENLQSRHDGKMLLSFVNEKIFLVLLDSSKSTTFA